MNMNSKEISLPHLVPHLPHLPPTKATRNETA